jgi:dimethylargininase
MTNATAFTRAVSPMIGDCALTHQVRTAIEPAKATEQHARYEDALRQAGLEVVRLPELLEHPDGVFVEDTALLLDGHAIITRPGAVSRADETSSTAAGLAGHFDVRWIRSGFLDGGDVLRIDRTLYVGASTRTDADGITALREIAGPIGFRVVEAKLGDCLHLKTGATFAGSDRWGTPTLLCSRRSVDPAQFEGVEPMDVEDGEPAAANALRVGAILIMPEGCPVTAARLRDRGFAVVEVDVSELQKAEAGVTCMSLISDPA